MSRRPRGRGRKPQHNNNNNKGNNPNRALDSNGPDVRVRGSAKTIYDKYMSLAHDASVSGKRVKAESYLQHAEHYLRIVQELAEVAEKKAEQQKLINEKREAEQAARRAEHEARIAKNKKKNDAQDAKGSKDAKNNDDAKPSKEESLGEDQNSDKPESGSRSYLNRRRNGKVSDKPVSSDEAKPEKLGSEKSGDGEVVKVTKKKRATKKTKTEDEAAAAE